MDRAVPIPKCVVIGMPRVRLKNAREKVALVSSRRARQAAFTMRRRSAIYGPITISSFAERGPSAADAKTGITAACKGAPSPYAHRAASARVGEIAQSVGRNLVLPEVNDRLTVG